MSKMLLLAAVIFFTACGSTKDKSPASKADKPAQGESTSGQADGIDIKVTKNGAPLMAFQTANDNAGEGALLTGKDLSIELSSPDRKWDLMISVSGAKVGAYPLADVAKNGKAAIRLTGGEDDNLMMTRADNGELKLDELSETSCSGSFKGTGSDATGNKYTYEGRFSRIKAFRQD